jgi:hypothetical protein
MKKQDDKKEQAIILAEKVRLLFGFYADLIPDKDLVNEVTGSLREKQSNALTMAPILGAFGMNL